MVTIRMSEKEAERRGFSKKAGRGKRRNKYLAVRTEVDGHVFDSKAEAAEYGRLVQMQRAGFIRDLEWRKSKLRMPIVVRGIKITHYTPDARYFDVIEGATIYLDVKSPATLKDRAFQLRAKLVKALYGIRITCLVIERKNRYYKMI